MHARRCDEWLTPRIHDEPGLGCVTTWPVHNKVGESPVWHAGEQALYWIDVRAPELLRLDPATGQVTRWRLPDVVGAVVLKRPHHAWLALRHAIVEFDLHTGHMRDIAPVEAHIATNRLNDGRVSPSGRWFVFGSMDDRPQKEPTGGLYRASADGRVEKLLDGLVVANGIAFDREGETIFFSDSNRGLVFWAPWNEQSGEIGEPSVFAVLGEELGRPDGAAMDTDGCYWSAGVSAGVLNKLDGQGRLLARLHLPCRAPTMVAYGGNDGATLYVTSLVRAEWEQPGIFDGALLSLAARSRGSPAPLLPE